MRKSTVADSREDVVEKPPVNPPDEFTVSLNEFCIRLSKTDKRVEMIGGFHHSMTKEGTTSGKTVFYQQAYTKFTTAPIPR